MEFLVLVLVVVTVAAAIFIWLYTVWDLARRRDITLLRRVVWFVVTLLAPFLGVIAYWLLRPRKPKSSV
ncbi:MAG TPA: PLDc N-terminal domain-containing protein [Thermoleophilia bacterium]|nr:PLDc N-terminal domain-containing protein [Thermoleophilia bacterium]